MMRSASGRAHRWAVPLITIALASVLVEGGGGSVPGPVGTSNLLHGVGTASGTPEANVAPSGVISVPQGAYGIAYDTANGDLFVAGLRSVTVIGGATNSLITTIPTRKDSQLITDAFDAANGNVYVTAYNNTFQGVEGVVFAINTATDHVVGAIPVGIDPRAIAYDSSNGYLYVANCYANGAVPGNVSVIDPAAGTVVRWVPTGICPGGIAVDSDNGDVYVSNGASGDITVIDGTTDLTVGSIDLAPAGLAGIAFDSSNGYLYVTSSTGGFSNGSYFVTAIDGATNQVVGTIPVGLEATAVAFDGSTGDLYVVDGTWLMNSGNVTVINGATDRVVRTVPVEPYPISIAIDGSTGCVYVGSWQSNNLTYFDCFPPGAVALIGYWVIGVPVGALVVAGVVILGVVRKRETSEEPPPFSAR